MGIFWKRWRFLPILFVTIAFLCTSLLVAPPKEANAATAYTVTASAINFSGAAGSVSPATQTINAGSTATITITWNPGYQVGSITDNGNLKNFKFDSSNTFQISPVQENHTVVVAYAIYEERHDYKSSVDGTTLPCSIGKPDPTNTTPTKIPLLVNLHAFGGQGNGVPAVGDMFVLSPWGRNYKSMYSDGKATARTDAPYIYDDFSTDPPPNWTVPAGTGGIWKDGRWSVAGGVYQQIDTALGWTMSDRNSSSGTNYTVTVDLKEAESRSTNESAMGIFLRRSTSNNEGYLVDLDNIGYIYVRLWRFQSGTWTCLARDPLTNNGVQVTENDAFWKNGVNLKVQVFEDAFEVHINNQVWNLDASASYAKKTPYWNNNDGKGDTSWGPRINDAAIASGSVALGSFGGVHQFDNFRVQNEFLFGETDIIDCINQFIEEFSNDPNYRVDPTKIYLFGISMGGVGTWTLGFQHPDLFSALHPTVGQTDFLRSIPWIKTYYPDSRDVPVNGAPGAYYMEEQDTHIGETTDAFLGGADPNNPSDADYALLRSSLHECSARWIQENALYTPMRIEHPEYDSLIPNTLNSDMDVCGLAFWWTWRINVPCMPRRFANLTPFAHDQAVWNKWYPSYPEDVSAAGSPANGLSKCKQETSGYGENGEMPPATPVKANGPSQTNIWDKLNYSTQITFGGHATSTIAEFNDIKYPVKILEFFQRANSAYYSTRVDPPEVAYKTYDLQHNRAWWLTVEAAYPNQESTDPAKEGQMAALVRVANGRKKSPAVDGADIHVKNTKTTTLDLTRMGIDTTNASLTATKTLTFKLDNNTAPEAQTVTDTYGKTTLKLAGTWVPAIWSSYSVKLGTTDLKSKSSMTGTVLTITDVPVTTTQTTLTVTLPKNDASNRMVNMLRDVNPGFETDASWTKPVYFGPIAGTGTGTGTFAFDGVEQAHTGARSGRIKDAKANATPYVASWVSKEATVGASTAYSASAFVKTRTLYSILRVFSGGKYDPNINAKAGVGILWLNSSKVPIRLDTMSSAEVSGSTDWTPVELRTTSPSTAKYAKVVVYTKSPNNQGASGSAWFDDVALRR